MRPSWLSSQPISRPEKQKSKLWTRFCTGGGIILLIPWAIVVGLGFIVYSSLMMMLIRCVCIYRGRYILFVHSNSPVWQDYIARNILPRLPPDTVLLNWSDHLKWKWFSFPVRVFRFYGRDTEFNPMGMVGTGLRGVQIFRFWQPFRDFKHGNENPLKEMEAAFFNSINKTKPRA